jgi:glycosyltransferase involved in cell wall biosynthesis
MVVHAYFPHDPRVAREVRAAQASGWEVDVLAIRRPGDPNVETVDGVRVRRLPITHSRGRGFGRLVVEYLGFTLAAVWVLGARSAFRRYAVVQVHNPPDFLVAAALVPKAFGARIVFDVHDLAPDMLDMRFHGRRWAASAEAIMRFVERLATRIADAVITVHEPYKAELTRRGVRPDDIVVVMNTVDEAVLPTEPAKPTDTFRIVYHGTVSPHYGVDLVVEATALLASHEPDIRLEIYGDGDAVDDVRALAERRGISDRVHVTGERLTQRDVLSRVAGASVGVVPNHPTRLNRFALSSKLFEYVVLGIPAVSADLPTIKAHFEADEVKYFQAGSAESLAEALIDVAQNPEAAAARVVAARRRYDEHYGWTVNSQRYVATLARLRGVDSP